MRLLVGTVLGIIIGGLIASTYLLHNENNVSTENIDRDLAQVAMEISVTRDEASKYAGGAILTLLTLRQTTYENTRAMLEQKRASLIHRIELRWTGEGSPPPSSTSELEGMEKEVKRLRDEIAKDDAEASLYSGGLVLALVEMRKAQHEISLASLEQALLARKYKLSLPMFAPQTETPPPAPVDLDDPNAKGAL